jgi:hypothetical protein
LIFSTFIIGKNKNKNRLKANKIDKIHKI